ncbi:hypothetical protein V2G26_015833 [Clonostachys chloroleuca]
MPYLDPKYGLFAHRLVRWESASNGQCKSVLGSTGLSFSTVRHRWQPSLRRNELSPWVVFCAGLSAPRKVRRKRLNRIGKDGCNHLGIDHDGKGRVWLLLLHPTHERLCFQPKLSFNSDHFGRSNDIYQWACQLAMDDC